MPEHPSSAGGRVFVLRHGQSHANVQRLIASSPANALDGFGLTSTGHEQVRVSVTAARAAGSLGGRVRVVSSPLLRARETAIIAAEVLGTAVHLDGRLAERSFGELELASDESYAQVWEADRADPSHERWGVESLESIHRRTTALLRELDVMQRTDERGDVVLCTHGDVASVLLCAAGGLALSRHREVGAMGNGELRALRSSATDDESPGAEGDVGTKTDLSGGMRAR